ncbi:MAG: HK97 family phage prohead protease [Wolbachia sp.]|nr:HK97 family phage prohead protease [Wolbachia sp.]
MFLGIQRAKEVYLMLKAGTIDGLLIGYIPVKCDVDHETGARILKQEELWEVSLVTFPANSAAKIINVKNQNNDQEMLVRAIKKASRLLSKLNF